MKTEEQKLMECAAITGCDPEKLRALAIAASKYNTVSSGDVLQRIRDNAERWAGEFDAC